MVIGVVEVMILCVLLFCVVFVIVCLDFRLNVEIDVIFVLFLDEMFWNILGLG